MYKQYRTFEKNEFILVSVDTASGMGDYTAAQFLSKTKIDVPLVYHSKITTSEYTPLLASTLNKIMDDTGVKPVVALERNAGGSFLIDRLVAINRELKYEVFKMPTYGRVMEGEPTIYGWNTNTATRPKMLADLKEAVDKRAIGIYDRSTINEMYSFILSKTTASIKAQAEKGAHDDLVMSLAIAWQMYQICEPPASNAYIESLIDEIPEQDLFLEDGSY